MHRTVLAVLLAVALLAASLPAADAAARDQAANRLRDGLDAIATAAGRLAATTDPVAPGRGGARTTVSLRVPHDRVIGSGGTATIGGCPTATTLCYRVGDGPAHGVRSPVDLRPSAENLTLPPGRHRLRLRHVRTNAGPTVVVAEV